MIQTGMKVAKIQGTCYDCGQKGHRSKDCWEREENASRRPPGWVSRKNKIERKEFANVNTEAVEFVL